MSTYLERISAALDDVRSRKWIASNKILMRRVDDIVDRTIELNPDVQDPAAEESTYKSIRGFIPEVLDAYNDSTNIDKREVIRVVLAMHNAEHAMNQYMHHMTEQDRENRRWFKTLFVKP